MAWLEIAGPSGWIGIHSLWIATAIASLLALVYVSIPVLRVRLRYRLAFGMSIFLRRIRHILGGSAARSRRVVPVALLGTAVSMVVNAAALSKELVPDPLAWAPFPDEAGITWLWVTAVGSVSFDAWFRDVISVDPGGWLRIEERRAAGARWVIAVPAAETDQPADDGGDDVGGSSSGLDIRYFVDGRPTAWDDAARDWLAQVMTTDPEWNGPLRALERDRLSSGGSLTTTDDAWASLIRVAPSMLATFGPSQLKWTLFGLGGPHPIDPSRPRLDPHAFDVATQAQVALFVAHHLAAHGLVTTAELEAFLNAIEAQLRLLEEEEPPPSGR